MIEFGSFCSMEDTIVPVDYLEAGMISDVGMEICRAVFVVYLMMPLSQNSMRLCAILFPQAVASPAFSTVATRALSWTSRSPLCNTVHVSVLND
jgi:hypothetical protein